MTVICDKPDVYHDNGRWWIMGTVILLNLANFAHWIAFPAIAKKAAAYYDVSGQIPINTKLKTDLRRRAGPNSNGELRSRGADLSDCHLSYWEQGPKNRGDHHQSPSSTLVLYLSHAQHYFIECKQEPEWKLEKATKHTSEPHIHCCLPGRNLELQE